MKIAFKKKWSDHICVGLLEYSVSVIYVFFYQYHTLNSFSLIVTFNLIFSLHNLRIALTQMHLKTIICFTLHRALEGKTIPVIFLLLPLSLSIPDRWMETRGCRTTMKLKTTRGKAALCVTVRPLVNCKTTSAVCWDMKEEKQVEEKLPRERNVSTQAPVRDGVQVRYEQSLP